MVKNLPCSAGDMRSIPGLGTKIPHTVEQLSCCTATAEPAGLEPVPCDREGAAVSSPRPQTREKPPLAATRGNLTGVCSV